MTRKSTKTHDRVDDAPILRYKFVCGSNNTSRSVYTIYEYPDGSICVQIEDKLSGGEMWMTLDDLIKHTVGVSKAVQEISVARLEANSGNLS